MRIAHVVTLISPDGAYGGPVRVAVNQVRALQDRGHDVDLFSTYVGFPTPPTEVDGVPITTFRALRVLPYTGFAGLASPGLLRHLWKVLRTYDVVHVHLARDLITLPAARLALAQGIPVVAQTHGMIDHSGNPLARALDAALTRPVLRRAATVFHLTKRERADLEGVARGRVRLTPLVNGVPHVAHDDIKRGAIEVLFLARLHRRKRPQAFVQAAITLSLEFPDVRFALVGPDEGEGAAVRALIDDAHLGDRLHWEGALPPERTLARMSQATIYVLPSIDEPFPMSVLEAASVSLPVIITDTCGLAEQVARWHAGAVIGNSVDELAETVRRFLLHPDDVRDCGTRAATMVRTEFGMETVVERLLAVYRAVDPRAEGAA